MKVWIKHEQYKNILAKTPWPAAHRQNILQKPWKRQAILNPLLPSVLYMNLKLRQQLTFSVVRSHLCNGWSIECQPNFPVLVMLTLFFQSDITLFKEIGECLFGTL